MASRERLVRLGTTLTRRAYRVATIRIVVRLLAAALVLALAVRLWQLWRREPIDFSQVDGAFFGLAVVMSAAAVTGYGLVWPYLLRRLGVHASASWVLLFFRTQLAKYLPGSIWQYAGRVGLAHARGVPVEPAVTSVFMEVALSATAAALVGLLLLGPSAALACALGIAGAGALVFAFRGRLSGAARRLWIRLPVGIRPASESVSAASRAAPAATGLYVLVWAAYGLAFWLTARALFAVPASDIPEYAGVFAVGWLVGLVAVFAPGGVGVREAVIVALLGGRLGEAQAIVLAGTSRVVLTAVDLVAGSISLGLPLPRRQDPSPVGAPR
jgi:uncharacterized membrane protein YbhN (UPF0104 family)